MLFDRYSGRLMTICYRYADERHEAEDMLQETFIKIFSNIHQYRGDGSFEGWLRRITVTTALRTLKKKKFHFKEINHHELTVTSIEKDAVSNLSEDELLALISELPTGYRIVFNLYVVEGYSHEEIGNMLGIETVTSRTQLAKARKQLQKQILHHQKIMQ